MTESSQERLTDLESRIAFAERLVDRLNDVILRQQNQIDALVAEVRRLRDHFDSPQDAMPDMEKPPHY